MTAKTLTQIKADIDAAVTTNGTGDIDGQDVRTVLNDLADSYDADATTKANAAAATGTTAAAAVATDLDVVETFLNTPTDRDSVLDDTFEFYVRKSDGTLMGVASMEQVRSILALDTSNTLNAVGRPVMKGGAYREGMPLYVIPTTYTEGEPDSRTYQWTLDGFDVVGATKRFFIPPVGSGNKVPAVKEIATKSGFEPTETVSLDGTAIYGRRVGGAIRLPSADDVNLLIAEEASEVGPDGMSGTYRLTPNDSAGGSQQHRVDWDSALNAGDVTAYVRAKAGVGDLRINLRVDTDGNAIDLDPSNGAVLNADGMTITTETLPGGWYGWKIEGLTAVAGDTCRLNVLDSTGAMTYTANDSDHLLVDGLEFYNTDADAWPQEVVPNPGATPITATLAKPAYLTPVIEPITDNPTTTDGRRPSFVMRITDDGANGFASGDDIRISYSKVCCENADGTTLTFHAINGQDVIIDGKTFARIAQQSHDFGGRWCNVDPDRFYYKDDRTIKYHNPRTGPAQSGSDPVLVDFTGDFVTDGDDRIGMGEGTWDKFGRRGVSHFENANGTSTLRAFDLDTGTVVRDIVVSDKSDLDWYGLSACGDYIVTNVNNAMTINGESCADDDFDFWRISDGARMNTFTVGGHVDVGLDHNGVSVAAGQRSSQRLELIRPISGNNSHFWPTDVSTSSVHTSMQGQPGVIVNCTFPKESGASSGNDKPLFDHLAIVRTDAAAGEVGIAGRAHQARQDTTGAYDKSPFAQRSRDGEITYFGSDWHDDDSDATGSGANAVYIATAGV